MNRTTAMAKCNPGAIQYDPKVDNDNHKKSASYDEALGFVASCHGVSCLAHYSLMPSSDKVSRNACAREIAKTLGIAGVPTIEAEIEIWVNRDFSFEDIGISQSHAEKLVSIMSRPRRLFKDDSELSDSEIKAKKKYMAYCFDIDHMNPDHREILPFIGKIREIRDDVFQLLNEWEMEWQRALGSVDKE